MADNAWFCDGAESAEAQVLGDWIRCENAEMEMSRSVNQERLATPMHIAAKQPWCRLRYRAVRRTAIYDRFKMLLRPDDPEQYIALPRGTSVALFRSGNHTTLAGAGPACRGTVIGAGATGIELMYSSLQSPQLYETICYDIAEQEDESTSNNRIKQIYSCQSLFTVDLPPRADDDASVETALPARGAPEPPLRDDSEGTPDEAARDAVVSKDTARDAVVSKDTATDAVVSKDTAKDAAVTELREARKRAKTWIQIFVGQGTRNHLRPFSSEASYYIEFANYEHKVMKHACLNEVQINAVRSAIRANPLCIIEGPPGTGKTRVLAAIIEILSMAGKRVVVSAPTNEAINNLMEACNHLSNIIRTGDLARCWGVAEQKHLEGIVRGDTTVGEQIVNLDQVCRQVNDTSEEGQKRKMTPAAIHEAGQQRQYLYRQAIAELDKRKPVLFGTCSSGADSNDIWQMRADYCIVDEGGKAVTPDVLLACLKSDRLIIAGDKYQLRPIVKARVSMNLDYQKSALENLMDIAIRVRPHVHIRRTANGECEEVMDAGALVYSQNSKLAKPAWNSLSPLINTLTLQYRCHPDIIKWSNRVFYNQRLQSVPPDEELGINCNNVVLSPIVFITTEHRPEFDEDHAYNRDYVVGYSTVTSKWNYLEAQFCLHYYSTMLAPKPTGQPENTNPALHPIKDVLIVSPYKVQVDIIRMLAGQQKLTNPNLRIGTIDSFQGQEADAVIISLVRSNCRLENGFVKDPYRMNVAITRARRHVCFVGNRTTIKEGGKNTEDLFKIVAHSGHTWSKRLGSLFSGGGIRNIDLYITDEWIDEQIMKTRTQQYDSQARDRGYGRGARERDEKAELQTPSYRRVEFMASKGTAYGRGYSSARGSPTSTRGQMSTSRSHFSGVSQYGRGQYSGRSSRRGAYRNVEGEVSRCELPFEEAPRRTASVYGNEDSSRRGYEEAPRRGYEEARRRGYEDAPRRGYERGYEEPPRRGYEGPPRRGYEGPPRRGYEVPPRRGYEEPPCRSYDEPPRRRGGYRDDETPAAQASRGQAYKERFDAHVARSYR